MAMKRGDKVLHVQKHKNRKREYTATVDEVDTVTNKKVKTKLSKKTFKENGKIDLSTEPETEDEIVPMPANLAASAAASPFKPDGFRLNERAMFVLRNIRDKPITDISTRRT